MSVSLKKGQKVDLTKGNAGLTRIMVGLGWDAVESKGGGGILSSIFGGGAKSAEIDCDASLIMLNANGKFASKENLVYYGNLTSKCGSVKHMGDNLTGEGEGDDEQIFVELSKVPRDIHRMVFVVNIYDCQKRQQDFGMIKNAFIRVVNHDNHQELLKFNLSDNYNGKTAVIVAEAYRHQEEWKFGTIGEATTDTSLNEMLRRYK